MPRPGQLASWCALFALGLMVACSGNSSPPPVPPPPDTVGPTEARPPDVAAREMRLEAAVPCSPSSCASGCCAQGKCVTTATDKQCGKSGGACLDCTAAGGKCTTAGNGAYCELPVTCDKTKCPTGCCQLKLCWTGVASTVCGAGGEQCADCAVSGRACTAQKCTGTATCDPTSCATGCCVAGTCNAGTQDKACGTKGAPCLDCTLSGQKCGNTTRVCQ